MAALPLAELYSVRDGKANIPEVKRFMQLSESQAKYANTNEDDKNQYINNELLQIISQGINNIVIQLKNRLGRNFNESNQNAADIMAELVRLGTAAKIQYDSFGKDNNINVPGARKIIPDPINVGDVKVDDANDAAFYPNKLQNDNINGNHLDTLDSNFQPVFGNQGYGNFLEEVNLDYDDFSGEITDYALHNRLRNCQSLEYLYLKKHDEIMKIFAFTINLFSKYKYAVKVMLYLLKNIVYKDVNPGDPPPPPPPPHQPIHIKLPKTIITNIKQLLADQAKIQNVITQMDNSIIKKNINIPDSDNTPKQAKLKKITSPKPVDGLQEIPNF